jgi:hypothetical protein
MGSGERTLAEGACDFVPKNKLARLVPIVERELKSKEKKKKPQTKKKGKK